MILFQNRVATIKNDVGTLDFNLYKVVPVLDKAIYLPFLTR